MKKLLIILFTALAVTALGQSKLKVNESHGEVAKLNGYNVEDVFALSTGGYWSLTSRVEGSGIAGLGLMKMKRVYFVQSYNEDMNLISEKKLNLRFEHKDLSLESIVQFQNDFYIFLKFDNIEKKKTYLFYALFDHHDLMIDGDLTKVAEIKLGSKATNSYPGTFDISVSENEEFLVIFGNEPQKRERRKRGLFGGRSSSSSSDVGTHTFKFTYWVLNEDFQIVNYEIKHDLKIENSSDKFYVRDYAVDNVGAIYILGKNKVVDELTRSEKRAKQTSNWVDIKKSAFVLEKINSDGSSSLIATPQDELFVDMDILFDKAGNVNLVGLTGEQIYSKLVTTGVYRMVLAPENLEMVSNANSEFFPDVLENVNDIQEREANQSKRRRKRQVRKDRKLTKEQKEFKEAAKRAALNANFIAYSGLDENGDAVIILEERHVRVVTTSSTDANGYTTTTTTYYYHYDDLIMAKFIDDEVVQNYYKKSFVSVNVPLVKSLDVSLKNSNINIMTQGHIVRADYDLQTIKDYELKAFSRKDKVPGMRRKVFTYRKTMDENTILAPAQWRRKVMWYKIQIK